MIKFLKQMKFTSIFHLVSLACIVGAILWSFTGEKQQEQVNIADLQVWDSGFIQVLDGEEIALDQVSEFTQVGVGETLVLTNELPELEGDEVLFFYSKDLEINIYVGDRQIYSLEIEEGFEYLESPGHLWNEVYLSTEDSGETIRIELTSQFSDRFMGTMTSLYLVKGKEIDGILLQENRFRYGMCLVTIYMTISAYINVFLWKRDKIRRYFMRLGDFYLSISLWLLGMTGVFNYIWDRPIVNMTICNLMVIVIPITVCGLYRILYSQENRLLHYAWICVWVNFFLQFILQFVFGISILTMLPLSYALYAIGAVVLLLLTLNYGYRYVRGKVDKDFFAFSLMSTLLFFIGAVAEIIVLCLFPKRTDLIGLSSVMGAFFYMIVSQIAIQHFGARADFQKNQIEEEYNNLQNVSLIEQIKAHFFFNTLNNISALCKYDQEATDKAIQIFARYMHSYMYLIDEKNNISIMQEIEILKATLEIEKLRFPDSFSYNIELDYTDFKIPPLSIQPIVENAIMHGLREHKDCGVLTIKVFKKHQMACIEIIDNGKGFDLAILEQSEGLGLNNLEKRIAIMADGMLSIESNVGKGTKVLVQIPLEPYY